MGQLYEKVMKGQYPRIPDQYSQDLAIVIKSMLQVKPKYRPSIDELLSHEIIKSRLNEYNLEDPMSENSLTKPEIEDLNNNYTTDLPSPNYSVDEDQQYF